jgi:hypothetical protein
MLPNTGAASQSYHYLLVHSYTIIWLPVKSNSSVMQWLLFIGKQWPWEFKVAALRLYLESAFGMLIYFPSHIQNTKCHYLM